MKRIILLCALFALFTTAIGGRMEACNATIAPAKKTKIQIAILLDTSGSMQGLIEQAKSKELFALSTSGSEEYCGTVNPESDLGNAITQSILEFAKGKGYKVERE